MAYRYNDLEALSIEELKKIYDKHATSTADSLGFFREEIARRESAVETTRMLEMTKQMRNMTIAISIMTFVNIFAVIIQIVR